MYHKLGNLVMAEKVIREAINIDPTAFEAFNFRSNSWFRRCELLGDRVPFILIWLNNIKVM